MKKLKLSIILLIAIICITGCFKKDNLEDIEIVTTAYSYEYVTNILYGKHSLVTSIYPDGTDINNYQLSKKVIKDYSKKELFIYNGLSDDKDLARDLLDYNSDLLIIDATSGMETTYGEEELWLNPSNLLMIAQNIKNGLNEYINHIEEDTLSSYPLILDKASVDSTALMTTLMKANQDKDYEEGKVYSNNIMTDMLYTDASEQK